MIAQQHYAEAVKRMKPSGDTSYVLAFNAGSSSLKFALFDIGGEARACTRGAVRDIGSSASVVEINSDANESRLIATHQEAAELILDVLLSESNRLGLSPHTVKATVHRVVHGGDRYTKPTLVTRAVHDELNQLAELAPLHMPPALEVIDEVARRFENVPAVAVFDTALFEGLPEIALAYAVPPRWREQHHIRRYGFHGIAHENMRDHVAASSALQKDQRRLVTLHLGHGCSATAFNGGVPVDTSMGFTPLEGLIMATRPGDIDVGAILHMQRQGDGWKVLDKELNRESGLLGLSGVSGDVRELLKLEESGHEGATLALQAFCNRALKYLGAYAVVLGGIDVLAFGGGIGENSPTVRRRICQGLEWLGLELDEAANESCVGKAQRISMAGSAIEVHVVPVDEEASLARAAMRFIEAEARDASGHRDLSRGAMKA